MKEAGPGEPWFNSCSCSPDESYPHIQGNVFRENPKSAEICEQGLDVDRGDFGI